MIKNYSKITTIPNRSAIILGISFELDIKIVIRANASCLLTVSVSAGPFY